MKIRELVDALLKNKGIIKNHRISWWTCGVLFVVSIFLATIPFYVSAFSSTNFDAYFPGIGEALYEFMDANACVIKEERLSCQKYEQKQSFGAYQVEVFGNETLATPNTMYFNQEMFLVDSGTGTVVQGNYANLGEFDFQEVDKMLSEGLLTKKEFGNLFLKNIELSAVSLNMMSITTTLFFQYLLYTLLLSYLFKFAKGRRDSWPYLYKDHVKMIVLSMFLPALVGAVVALFVPGIASVIFPFAYVVRVVFLYMRLARYAQ